MGVWGKMRFFPWHGGVEKKVFFSWGKDAHERGICFCVGGPECGIISSHTRNSLMPHINLVLLEPYACDPS